MNIYVASNNSGKIKEISKCFPNGNIFSQTDIEKLFNIKIDIDENGKTFYDNAKIKVTAIAQILKNSIKSDDIIIADDSGIVIPSLPDMLGVYTKRQMLKWCKENANSTEIDFYNHISSITPSPKTCIFEAVIAIITNGTFKSYTGTLKGTLAPICRGNNGFGFDPIFEYEGKTLAEMSDEEKTTLNPRIKAIGKMKLDLYQ